MNMNKALSDALRACIAFSLLFFTLASIKAATDTVEKSDLVQSFKSPPPTARPGVYWYFMDGNLSKEGMTKDLEAMVEAGIGYLVYLEVNVGVPRGDVDFLSPAWRELFKHALEECERLGIQMTLGVGPGWTGSGGPWVRPEQSMQHLVSSTIEVTGGSMQQIILPKPDPKPPFFGEHGFTSEMREHWREFYQDVALLAFPTPEKGELISDVDEKALYYRAPYSSQPGVKQYLPPPYDDGEAGPFLIEQNQILDLISKMDAEGVLSWNVPEGNWTLMRFGARNNGAVTRPAPLPGVGMECDKFSRAALHAHFEEFLEKLFDTIGPRDTNLFGGLKMLHMDSWEMGAQNWNAHFREEFKSRRKYDPLPFYPVYAGFIVENKEVSERFLWDLRLTCQELILENHAGAVKEYAHRLGPGLSIEPYDMNPTADLELASVADMPMCEFWSQGYGFNTSFSLIEGSSAAHLLGQPVVPAEAFTAHLDGWRQHPGSMKNQTDWALAGGINRLVYHTFQHQCLDDSLRPGMTMGPYGVHWDRNQTWWPMADAYHQYVARAQYLLQQGRTVADILYLTPEGAPFVFRAPESALAGTESFLPDRREYNFDASPPGMLYRAEVKNGKIVFPGGAMYRVLILPDYPTMTPELLEKIKELINAGATVVGNPPHKSPSLTGYPESDRQVRTLIREIWGELNESRRAFGKGVIIRNQHNPDNLYQPYSATMELLDSVEIPADFYASSGKIRYGHRTMENCEIYFLANRSEKKVKDICSFRVSGMLPELWNPMTGEIRMLPQFTQKEGLIEIPLEWERFESYFILFRKEIAASSKSEGVNFLELEPALTITGPWSVSFDPAWGGPDSIVFEELLDWTEHGNPGIKYYSGTALYKQTFDIPEGAVVKILNAVSSGSEKTRYYLDLGSVENMARVHLNGQEVGTLWTTPWRLEITDVLKEKGNELEIEVVNLWPNRLIGDEQLPDDGIEGGQWPKWLLEKQPRSSGRYTFTTYRHFGKDSPLLKSGLLGPVSIQRGK